MPAKTPGERQAQKFFGTINSLDFDIVMFLFELDKQSFPMKQRVFTMFSMLIDDWAMRYDCNLWKNDQEMQLFVEAKRIQEALSPYLMGEYE